MKDAMTAKKNKYLARQRELTRRRMQLWCDVRERLCKDGLLVSLWGNWPDIVKWREYDS